MSADSQVGQASPDLLKSGITESTKRRRGRLLEAVGAVGTDFDWPILSSAR